MDKQQIQIGRQQVPGHQRSVFKTHFADVENKRPFCVTIYKKSPAEVMALLNQIDNFPQFFDGLVRIDPNGGTSEKWSFGDSDLSQAAFTVSMQRLVDATENTIVWKAEDGAGFDFTLAIALSEAPAGRGTVVFLLTSYDTAMGEIGGKFLKLFGKDAEVIGKKNLFRLKAFCETGSVPTTVGQPSGRDEDQQPQDLRH